MQPIVTDGVRSGVVCLSVTIDVLDGCCAHWRRLANMIELSVCGGDEALCQITLTTC